MYQMYVYINISFSSSSLRMLEQSNKTTDKASRSVRLTKKLIEYYWTLRNLIQRLEPFVVAQYSCTLTMHCLVCKISIC